MIHTSQFFTVLLLVLLSSSLSYAQEDIIRLKNSSFEDLPRAGQAPKNWTSCGFPGETPPDIQPDGTFKVSHSAYDGGTYLGMVVRDNDSWERIGQRLSKPITANQCYSFSIFLCRSPIYESRSQKTNQIANYVRPVKLRVWGGDSYCAKREQLAETGLVSNFDWRRFELKFEPTQSHKYILFEAFYETPVLFPYNGNILLDNASAIVPIPCNTNEIVRVKTPEVDFIVPATANQKVDNKGITVQARVRNVSPNLSITFLVNNKSVKDFYFNPDTGTFQADLRKFKEGKNTIRIIASNNAGESNDTGTLIYEQEQAPLAEARTNVPPAYNKPTTPKEKTPRVTQQPKPPTPKKDNSVTIREVPNKENKAIGGISKKNMRAGQTIKLNKLYFAKNDSTINTNSYGTLNEIYDFLRYNQDVVIEIGGHTNGNCEDSYCDELSTARAKAVAEYLANKGINGERLQYRGYGKRKPVYSNRTAVGRKQNQRVEIKILSMNG